jgi:FkbM family methyltransferase
VTDNLSNELKNILREDTDRIIEREQSSFDVQAAPFGESIVLFGAGELGRKTLAGLRKAGVEPLAFSDNNASLWGSSIDGVRVLSPRDAAEQFGRKASFVVTIWRAGGGHRFANTRKQLIDLHCSTVVSFAALFWKYADIFLPYYALGLPHTFKEQEGLIERAFDLWEDDSSRREYLHQLRFRFALDFDNLPSPVAHDQYFPDDLFRIKNDEVLVDCGAFDGDTIKALLEVHLPAFHGEIIALEPDPENLKKLNHYIGGLDAHVRSRITILPFAAGSRRETVCFSATGTAAAVIDRAGSLRVDCVPLDEILKTVQPTYIKMDIEGAELDALAGAKNTIQKYAPILAISVYHQPDHLWRIPLLISSLSSGYRYFLRPHNEEGWDLVCYAIPIVRLTTQ